MSVQIKLIEHNLCYDGTQLAPHWIYKNWGLLGNALVAFRGPCQVSIEKMVDLVDVKENKPIYSEDMLHFLAEFFDSDLEKTILFQRLLVSLAEQEITFRCEKPIRIIRGGNDLYEGEAKLSVAIATASPISTLLHFGINISSKGTPVKTKGLQDYNIEPESFAKALLESFRHEWLSVRDARAKVRAVL